MNLLLNKPAEFKLLGDGARPFEAMVAYDGAMGCNNAKRFYLRLVEEFGGEFDLESRWWSFEQLGETQSAENAARAARVADMVIISTATKDLPRHTRLWIESSLAAREEQDMALVALIVATQSQKGPATEVFTYLERVARQAGVSYFADLSEFPEPMLSCTIEALQYRGETVTPLMDEILHSPPSPHWGINE